MFPGIADRMQKELTALAPSSMKVRASFRSADVVPSAHVIPFSRIHRSRLSLLPRGSTPSGLVDPFSPRSPPSRTSGAPSRSTMSPAPASSTAVRTLPFLHPLHLANLPSPHRMLLSFLVGGRSSRVRGAKWRSVACSCSLVVRKRRLLNLNQLVVLEFSLHRYRSAIVLYLL